MANQQKQFENRGEEMALELDKKGLRIYKYPIPIIEEFSIILPKGAEIIRLDFIEGHAWLWAKIDQRVEDEKRYFRAFKTGALIPDNLDIKYIGMYPIFIQVELMLYVYEEFK